MKNTYKRIPFDLEIAKKIFNGEIKGRFITDDNDHWEVRIICFTTMEKFKKIEDYPIVNDGISTEEWRSKLSKYDDYIKDAQEKSRRAAIWAWEKTKDVVLD